MTVIALAAWLLPGAGHLLQRRWGRGLIFFGAVGGLAALGLLMRGHIFSPHSGDVFELLGYVADLGAGLLFFLAQAIDNGGPDVSRAAGDYGTRLFATAGVLNLLCVIDACDIAQGRKE